MVNEILFEQAYSLIVTPLTTLIVTVGMMWHQGLIELPYVFWFGTGQCRCSSKVPSRLPTLSLVEGRKRTDTSLIPMGLDCVCGRCGHWNKLGENYYMKKEKERENCPSQGGISSKINSCQGGRLNLEVELLPVAVMWSRLAVLELRNENKLEWRN